MVKASGSTGSGVMVGAVFPPPLVTVTVAVGLSATPTELDTRTQNAKVPGLPKTPVVNDGESVPTGADVSGEVP